MRRAQSNRALDLTPAKPLLRSPAGQLGVGTSIVTRAGPCLTVSAVHLLPEQVGGYAVYNLTVEGDHTYFVGSVGGGAWVHNYDCTAIGRMEDLEKYKGTTVDTWWETGRLPSRDGGGPVTWAENEKWLDDRIARGDPFRLATPESSLGTTYKPGEPNGYFTWRELQHLRKNGIEPTPDY